MAGGWYRPWRHDDKREKEASRSAAALQAQILEAEEKRRATEASRLLRSRDGYGRSGRSMRGATILTGMIGLLGGGQTARRSLGGPT